MRLKITAVLALTLVAAPFLTAGFASTAFVDYSTDFTSADGFSEGASIDEIDGWNATRFNRTADTDTFGSVRLGLFGLAGITQRDSGGSWNVGDTITLSAGVFYGDTSISSKFSLGLTDLTNDTSGQPKVGFEFDATNTITSDIFAIGGGINEDTNLDYTQGHANGETYTLEFTKSPAVNEIDVNVSIRGGAYTNSFTVTDATIYTAANVYGHIQHATNSDAAEGFLDS